MNQIQTFATSAIATVPFPCNVVRATLTILGPAEMPYLVKNELGKAWVMPSRRPDAYHPTEVSAHETLVITEGKVVHIQMIADASVERMPKLFDLAVEVASKIDAIVELVVLLQDHKFGMALVERRS